ncbi:MAG: hypothetical protein ACYSUC_13480 [Planctomycetota bacterium]
MAEEENCEDMIKAIAQLANNNASVAVKILAWAYRATRTATLTRPCNFTSTMPHPRRRRCCWILTEVSASVILTSICGPTGPDDKLTIGGKKMRASGRWYPI